MIWTPALSLMLAVLLPLGVAAAEDVTISQENKAFSTKEVSVKVGDSITFENNDSVTHNIYSRSKGNRFDSGAQAPNASMTRIFSAPGKVKIRCAIHPRMKLTVNVE